MPPRVRRARWRKASRPTRIAADGGWPIALLGVRCIVCEVPADNDPAALLRMAHDRRVDRCSRSRRSRQSSA
jgi:hypothetical protein